jgi:hypothetical protein
MSPTPVRAAVVLALAGAAAIGLTACTADDPATEPTSTSSPSSTPSTEPSPSDSPSVSATPSATPTPTADAGEPVELSCEQLISAQQMYDYNNNFSLSDEFAPAPGSRAASAVEYQGLACEWVNDSSGDTIDIAVAKLSPATIEALTADAASAGKATTAFGVDGYFAVSGDEGRVDAFSDGYWIIADSEFFAEPADAKPLVLDAIAALE